MTIKHTPYIYIYIHPPTRDKHQHCFLLDGRKRIFIFGPKNNYKVCGENGLQVPERGLENWKAKEVGALG